MTNLSVTGILNDYHHFDREFWLSYKTIEKLMPKSRFEEIKMNLLRTKRIDTRYISEVSELAFNTERNLLDLEWKTKSEEAKQNGITLHETIRDNYTTNLSLIKDFGVDLHGLRVLNTEAFLQSESGLFPEFRMEIKLSDDYTLVGIADLIIKEGNSISIIDWKSNDKISTKSHYDVGLKKAKCLKYPLSKFEDCDLVKYLLLLSMYAWMCQELNPEFIIDTLSIVQIKDFKKYKSWNVEYLKQDINKLLQWHVKNTKMKEDMAKCNSTVF